MFPDKIYYEPQIITYELGKYLKEKYKNIPWIEIDNHNKIDELRTNSNKQFAKMKQHLIIGVRKTHKYVENHKVSDYLVPYTSSGCSAMCLYCYLVCNYNKCSYLRLFVNREQMLDKIIRTANKAEKNLTFEIGSNSDLILENTITSNLVWTIEHFGKSKKGLLTFPTKFDMVDPLLPLEHNGKVIVRVSVNPEVIIRKVEFGTSTLKNRIIAINKLCDAGYKVGLLIAPVILLDDWKYLYSNLIEQLADELSEKVKKEAFIEIIFMTYSFVHNAINQEAFPKAINLLDKDAMKGRGMGKYCYKTELRADGEQFLRDELNKKLPQMNIIYVV